MSIVVLATACAGERPVPEPEPPVGVDTVRVALFNIRELSAEKLTEGAQTGVGSNAQLRAAADIIQRIAPDLLVLNEIDHDLSERSLDVHAREFARLYLATDESPTPYPYTFAGPNNTGVASGLDLNGDGIAASIADEGTREYGEDAFGFGLYPGQYSMAVLSSYPLARNRARTFQRFRWKDLPESHMPEAFYSRAVEESLRLSSKSHWDLPVQLPNGFMRLLLSHPTPPVFDGDEDRNGRRNFDEVGFWARYLNDSPWLYDDGGRMGGYDSNEPFLIAGDLNARPDAVEGFYDGMPSILQLLEHPRVLDTGTMLTSNGALNGQDPGPPGYPERSTAVFGGGWRLDYLLPSLGTEVINGGVFWPSVADDPDGATLAELASDHRLVWLDLIVGGRQP